jgi:phage terminase large subunit-like protein
MAYSARVKAVIDYIELLTIPSGVGAGGPFVLRPWQRRFINKVYGPRTKIGLRKVRRAIDSMARKNGKTALIAALVLVHLDGPEWEYNGEIYSAANEREQAGIVFKYVYQMIEVEPELSDHLKVVKSTKTIVNFQNGSTYKALSADAGSKFGLNPTVAIYDELAQAKNRDLFDALDTSMGARAEPLLIVISTQSPDPQHVLSELIDDGLSGRDKTTVVELHAVPDDCEDIFDPAVWKLANPALGDFRSYKDLEILAQRAARMPSFETAFRNLYLNQRIDRKNPLIAPAEWKACKDDACTIQPGEDVYMGLDLSATTDLCALGMVSAEDHDRTAAWFWKPGQLLDDQERRDRVPYRVWVDMGLIDAPDARAIDYGHVAIKLGELRDTFRVLGVAYDRWRVELLLKELDRVGIDTWVDGKDKRRAGALRLVPWGQGYKDMAPAVDALETSVIERKFKHNGNPVLTWNMQNAMAITDPAGNRKLDKSKTRFRIDGAIAITMAIGLKYREIEPAPREIKMPVSA